MSVGANLRRLREAAGLSQVELAERVQVSNAMLCQIERGTRAPSLQLGIELANALNCAVTELADTEEMRAEHGGLTATSA